VLEKEHDVLKKKKGKDKAEREFGKEIKEKIQFLEKKEKGLIKKEKEIKKRLEFVAVMEKNLKQLSKKLKKDEKSIDKEKRFLKSKELRENILLP